MEERLKDISSIAVVTSGYNQFPHSMYWPGGAIHLSIFKILTEISQRGDEVQYSYFGDIRNSPNELRRAATFLLKIFQEDTQSLVLYDRTIASILYEHSEELGHLFSNQECYEIENSSEGVFRDVEFLYSFFTEDDPNMSEGDVLRDAKLLLNREEAISHLCEYESGLGRDSNIRERREELLRDIKNTLHADLEDKEDTCDDFSRSFAFAAYSSYYVWLQAALSTPLNVPGQPLPPVTTNTTVILSWFKVVIASAHSESVLIEGPPGVEKNSFIDCYIHNCIQYTGSDMPVMRVDLSAIPSNLLVFELFGYEAAGECMKAGFIENAENGILVLEELQTVPMETQAMIGSFLRNGTIRRIGTSKGIPIKTTVLATISDSVSGLLSEKRLRKDIVNSFTTHVSIPPLCDRVQDIRLLIEYYWPEGIGEIPEEHMEALVNRHWEENVDELSRYMKHYPFTHLLRYSTGDLFSFRKGVEYGLHRAIDALIANHQADDAVSVRDELDTVLFKYLHTRYEGYKAAAERATGIKSSTISDQWDRLKLGHRRQSGMKSASSETDSED